MRLPDATLDSIHERGFAIVERFLDADALARARDALWRNVPTPEQFTADPDAQRRFGRSQFAGLQTFPFDGWDLNRLAFHPDLVDAAERYLGLADVELYKVELWAKYAGAIDYDQPLHRDFGNHSLVVPTNRRVDTQLTTFILLSDVTDADGATRIVPLEHSREIDMVPDVGTAGWNFSLPVGELRDVEIPITGPAGTLLIYRTDVLHRGANFTSADRSRFVLLADYQRRGMAWAGKMSWPDHALSEHFVEVMERATVRERDLFGFPPPGSWYWNDETIRGVQRRYPKMDLAPYSATHSTPRDDT